MQGSAWGFRWDIGRHPCWHICLWVPWRRPNRPLVYLYYIPRS